MTDETDVKDFARVFGDAVRRARNDEVRYELVSPLGMPIDIVAVVVAEKDVDLDRIEAAAVTFTRLAVARMRRREAT